MLRPFLSGMITAGFLTGSLFFARFWWRTRDRLFAAFTVAFVLLAFDQAALTLGDVPREERSLLYLVRLAAFALICAAIAYKNRRPGPGS